MILHYPQWQGIGFPTKVTQGAARLCSLLKAPAKAHTVPVADKATLEIEDGIFGRAQITAQLAHALEALKAQKPARVLTIGGDCSVEVAPSSYLNELYNGDLQIFWFDAHADINTPDTSFSAHFHGMPLGLLLGEAKGDPLNLYIPKPVMPDQIAYIGLRSIDPPEEEYIAAHNIKNMTFAQLYDMPKKYTRAIIHLDTDVMDSSIYNECSTPTSGGADVPTLIAAMNHIYKHYDVVGTTITEYAPNKADTALPLVTELFLKGLRAEEFA